MNLTRRSLIKGGVAVAGTGLTGLSTPAFAQNYN